MVEAVGQRWWGAYLDSIARNLKAGGRAALQFISIDHALFDNYVRNADFIQTYIFPGGCLLDEPQFAGLAIERGLSWQDRVGFRLDYAETLKRWRDQYNRGGHGRRARRVQRTVPRPLALLSDVLRGRLSRRGHRCRPGDDGQILKAIYDRERALGEGLAAIRTQFQLPSGFPPEVERLPPLRRDERWRITSIARPLSSSRSILRARPISTRHLRSSNPGATSSCAMRLPTSAGLSPMKARSTSKPGHAAKRFTCPDGKVSLYPTGTERRRGEPVAGRRQAGHHLCGARGSRRDFNPRFRRTSDRKKPRKAWLCDGSPRGPPRWLYRTVPSHRGSGTGARRIARGSAAAGGRARKAAAASASSSVP